MFHLRPLLLVDEALLEVNKKTRVCLHGGSYIRGCDFLKGSDGQQVVYCQLCIFNASGVILYIFVVVTFLGSSPFSHLSHPTKG